MSSWYFGGLRLARILESCFHEPFSIVVVVKHVLLRYGCTQFADTHVMTSQVQTVKFPPTTYAGTLSCLGPSMILSASIVGSGELIMTTTLGAEAGFVALWVIILSCMVKVSVQLEFGKHAISSGESTMAALDGLRGPRLAGVRWTIWIWLLVQLVIFLQYGGIVTGVGQAINIAIPAVPVWAWASLAGLATAVLVSCGRYRMIQNVSVTLMGLFTLFTLICVGLLQSTEYAISSE